MKVLKDKLMIFLKEYKIDVCLIYAIHSNYAVRVLSAFDERKDVEYNFSEFLNFDSNKDSAIYAILNQNGIIINKEKKFMSLVKGAENEVYIPFAYNGEVFACAYFASFNYEEIVVDILKLNQIIIDHILDIQRTLYEKLSYKSLIENIILIHEIFNEKTDFMTRHIYNVASWAIQIGKKLKYSDEDLTKLYLASLMHDIGKIFIDKNVLNKRGKLTEEEYNEMKKHVEIGYNIAKDMFLFELNPEIPLWIYQHHEKWDGTGYPNKIKGEEIIKEARILKIADSLDAMLVERTYKKQKDLKEAILELKLCCGKDFDPEISKIAIEILNEKLNYSNKILDDIFLPAKLIVNTNNGEYSYDGFISKSGEETLFNSVKTIEKIEDTIINNTLVVEKQNIIFEYKVKIKTIDSNKLQLFDIIVKESEKHFGLLWLLRGNIIIPSIKDSKEITITRISGDDLIFNFDDDYEFNEENVTIIVVQFDDGTKIPLTGQITNKIRLNKVLHYQFTFAGIKEKYRDEVFRQIFRKQISLKKILNEDTIRMNRNEQ